MAWTRAFPTLASGSRVLKLTSWPPQKSCGGRKTDHTRRFPQYTQAPSQNNKTSTLPTSKGASWSQPPSTGLHTGWSIRPYSTYSGAHPTPVHWICLSFLYLFAPTVSVTKNTKICLNQICHSVQIQYYTSQAAMGSKMRFNMPSKKPSGKVSRLSFVK